MQQRQMWIATAAVILTVIGGALAVGRNMATRDDVAGLAAATREDVAGIRAEIQANREATEARFDELPNREATEARFDELRTEIQAAQESADSQMEELRGYIVQHLDQHSRSDE